MYLRPIYCTRMKTEGSRHPVTSSTTSASRYGPWLPSNSQKMLIQSSLCTLCAHVLLRNIQQGRMLSCLGTATDLLDVPKQHCEPSLYGNIAPSDGPHMHKLDSMCSYKAQHAPLVRLGEHPAMHGTTQ